MTAPKTQIQELINRIDEVLQASDTHLQRSQTQDDVYQQQVLEQTRNYLASLEENTTSISQQIPDTVDSQRLQPLNLPGGEKLEQPDHLIQMNEADSAFTSGWASPSESAHQVLQAVVQEMNYLRVNMMQPLREELMTLYQQRQLLTADIQRLEQQRYQLMLSQKQFDQQQIITDFMQSLMEKLQEQLASQVAQTYANYELQASQLPPSENLSGQPQLTPGQRLQHMQKLQTQSDEVMLKLDSTLRIVFESLQTNMDSYQDSLVQGLEKMHGLGQQGEAMFAALVNRFAEQLGRGASYYLQSSIKKEWELPGLGNVAGPDAGLMPRHPVQNEEQVSVPDKLPEDQLNRFIHSLDVPSANVSGYQDDMFGRDKSDSSANQLLNEFDDFLDDLDSGTSLVVDDIDFDLSDLDLFENVFSLDNAARELENERTQDIEPTPDLFELNEDGVHPHLDQKQITQIHNADADSLLSDLTRLTLSDETSEEIDEGRQVSPSDADEALSFLNQVATELEDDLSRSIAPTQDQGSIQPDDREFHADPQQSHQEQMEPLENDQSVESSNQVLSSADPSQQLFPSKHTSSNDDTELSDIERIIKTSDSEDDDEINDLYQLLDDADIFSSADASLQSGGLSFWGVPNENPKTVEDIPTRIHPGSDFGQKTDVPPEHFSDAQKANNQNAIQPASALNQYSTNEEGFDQDLSETLSDLFVDIGHDSEDGIQAFGGTSLESSERLDPDLLAEIGLTTQDSSNKPLKLHSQSIETIHSLTEIVDDLEVRASIEAEINQPNDSDRYALASPEEDLLANDGAQRQVDVSFPLDDHQRQRLVADLAQLEGLDPSEVLADHITEGGPSTLNNEEGDRTLRNNSVESFLFSDDDFFSENTVKDILSNERSSPSVETEELTYEEIFQDSLEDSTYGLQSPSVVSDTNGIETPQLDSIEAPTTKDLNNSVPHQDEVGQSPSNEQVGSLDMTFDHLFPSNSETDDTASEPSHSHSESSLPFPYDQFNVDEELQGIFEDLQEIELSDEEGSQAQEEQTLMDLMKGLNQPTLPLTEPTSTDTDKPETDSSM